MSEHRDLGQRNIDIEKLGRAKTTDLIRVALAACERHLSFQPDTLLRILDLTSSKYFFLFLLIKRSSPGYLALEGNLR